MDLEEKYIEPLRELAQNGDEVAIEGLEAAGLWENADEIHVRVEKSETQEYNVSNII